MIPASAKTIARTMVLAITTITFNCFTVAAAPVYDAVNDFSIGSNPNGAWAYGTTGTSLAGLFTAFTIADTTLIPGVDAWTASGGFPQVGHNTTGSTINAFGVLHIPADQLFLHPGSAGEYAVVQWTAPVGISGPLYIAGLFSGLDDTPTTTDVHVLLNGSSMFSSNISSQGTPTPFSFTQSLNPGDVLTFAVGYGANGNYQNDGTGFNVTISDVPETSSTYLTSFGLAAVLGLALMNRRRFSRN